MSLSGAVSVAIDDLCEAFAPLGRRFGRRARRVAAPDGERLALYEIFSDGAAKRLPAGARGPAELRIPANLVVARALAVPAAGRDFLQPIIEHRLERLIPWAPDRALYGYRVAGDAPNGEIAVEFAAASRDKAEEWVRRAEAEGIVPTALVSAAEPLDAAEPIDLWRGARDPGRARLRRNVTVAIAAVALVLTPLCAASFWFAHQAGARLEAVEARAAAARRALRIATGGGPGSPEARMIEAKRLEDSATALIDRLASVLPDDTALRALEIDGERVRISGASAAASGLIGVLEGSGALRDARFTAPVVRQPDGRDGFEIAAARLRAASDAAGSGTP